MGLYTKIKGPVNYTAIGTLPTISNGIASNFTTTSGLMTDTDLIDTENWEMQIKFYNTGTSNNYIMLIGTRGFGMDFVIASSRKASVYLSSTGSSWNYASNVQGTYSIPTNQWIYYKLIKTSLLFQAYYSLDGLNWTKDIEISMPDKLGYSSATYAKRVAIGYLNESNSHPFLGQIDLNETYINVDGIAWFGKSFSKVKVKSGLARYTVVGSPTIENGIASGFSNNNYLIIPAKDIFTNANTWEMQFKFIGELTRSYLVGTDKQRVITFEGKRLWLSSNGTSWNMANGIGTSVALPDNSYSRVRFTGTQYIYDYSADGITWTNCATLDSTTKLASIDYIILGKWIDGYSYSGTVDLNNSYIKVNGAYFFRGSKQDILGYKIQQDNFSKYYTIVDGKLMWASPNIYLHFDGNSWIDTKFKPNQDTKVEIIYSPEQSSKQYECLFGSRNSSSPYNNFQVFISPFNYSYSTGRFDYGNGTSNFSYTTEIGKKYKVVADKNQLYINDTLVSTRTYSEFQGNYDIVIGGSNVGGTVEGTRSIKKYYSSKLYDNNKLIRHFVPVPKGLLIGNFVVPSSGMFDIVEQKFYPNQGTGEFEIGGIPPHYIIEGGKLIWCRDDIYLESTGTQYIDTGHHANGGTIVEGKFQFTDGTVQQRVFGADGNNSDYTGLYSMSLYINGSSKYAFSCNDGQGSWSATLVSKDMNWHTYKLGKPVNYLYLDNTQTVAISGNQNAIAEHSLLIFTSYRGSNSLQLSKVKEAYFIIYQDSVIKQYLVPVPKGMLIGDKIAPSNCMFDMVTQTFFENQGTGDFIIGGIPSDYMIEGDKMIWCNPDVYLSKSSGVPYFNSGIIPSNKTEYEFSYKQVSLGKVSRLYGYWNNGTSGSYNIGGPSLYGGVDSSYNHYAKYNDSTTFSKSESTMSSNTKHTISLKGGKYYFDGVEQGEVFTSTQFTCNGPMFVGNINIVPGGNNIVSNNGDLVYSWLCWNNSRLLQYLVPVPKNMLVKDKIAPSNCMFDLVTQKFFTNQGTGDFAIGGLSGDLINTGDNIVWTHENVYLQSSGTQYIDTELNPDDTYNFEGAFLSTNTDRFLFGRRTSTTSNDAIMINTSGSISSPTVYYNYGSGGFLTSSDNVIKYNEKFFIKIENGKLYWNNTLLLSSSYSLSTSSNYSLWLFDVHQQNSINRPLYGKCYNFIVKTNNTLICYFLPVNTNTVIGSFTVPSPGMWDAVTRKFYPNKGTGSFTYGKDS